MSVKFRDVAALRNAGASTNEFVKEAGAIFARMDYLMRGDALNADEQREYDALEAMYDGIHDSSEVATIDRSGVVDPRASFGREDKFEEGKPLAPEQRLADYVFARGEVPEDQQSLDLGKYLRGIVSGDWKNAHRELKAMSEGTNSAGGYMVPTLLSAEIIDLARNQTRVFQAGAKIVPMSNKTVDIAKWTGDPTPAWHTEAATISPSDATIGKVTLTAKTLAGLTIVSRELLEDAPNVDQELRDAFAADFALTVDRAALYGSGTPPEPQGVRTASGVTIQSMGTNGAALSNSWNPFIDAVGALQDNNEQATGIIYAPRTARVIGKFVDSTGQPLQKPGFLDNVPEYVTNQVPINLTQGTSNVASDAFVADWHQLYVGVRTSLEIRVLTERYADTGQVGFVCWWRGDNAVARAKAFTVIEGIL
jgi:HK97 family phage major capsid protein